MGLIEEAMARRNGRPAGPRRSLRTNVPIRSDFSLDALKQVEPDGDAYEKDRLICGSMDPSAVGAYKMLRTQVAHRLRARRWSSIGVTTARPGEGKTLTAINLALSLAMNPEQHVFLVDFDLRRHCVANYLGVTGCNGLLQALQGEPLEETLVRYRNERVYALLNDQTIEDSSEILGSDEAIRLSTRLKELGGIVIYDLPPLLSADDYLAFSEHIDCTLLVVAESQTQREDVVQSRELIDPERLLGVVLNKSRDRTAAGGYYY